MLGLFTGCCLFFFYSFFMEFVAFLGFLCFLFFFKCSDLGIFESWFFFFW